MNFCRGTTPEENCCSLVPPPEWDDMGDEECPCFEPLPPGACCARCWHCDSRKTHCAKLNCPVYTPDASPCRDYTPFLEEDAPQPGEMLPGMNGNNEHQFKPGEHADLRVLIDCITLEGDAFVYAESPVGSDWPGLVPLSALSPAPREGEYRLTEDELIDFACDFELEWCRRGGMIHDESREFVREWVENRKEEA